MDALGGMMAGGPPAMPPAPGGAVDELRATTKRESGKGKKKGKKKGAKTMKKHTRRGGRR